MIHTSHPLLVIFNNQLETAVYTKIQWKFDAKCINYLPHERFGKKLEKVLDLNKLSQPSIRLFYTKAQKTAKVLINFNNYSVCTHSLESNIKYRVTYSSTHTINRQMFINNNRVNSNNSSTSHPLSNKQPTIVTFIE